MKRPLTLLLVIVFTLSSVRAAPQPALISPSAILMERDSGEIIYSKDADKKLPPASVTKVMTLLLVMESIDSKQISYDDIVTVSEHAASMGGSQVFLKAGEQMSVRDLLKATIIASGNDSAVALAEHISGSEEAFIDKMNKRAAELGMISTTFKNCTGLDCEGHVTSAHDIAIMSRELIKHDGIKDFTTIWTDSLRNGEFQLANTNKLIRTYKGITGLKTGSTSVAKFCLSATAERDGMELIAEILAGPTSKDRFSDASALLDFGFANYTLHNCEKELSFSPVPVILGKEDSVPLSLAASPATLITKEEKANIKTEIELPSEIKAPVEKGQKIGCIKILNKDTVINEIPIVAQKSINKLTVGEIFMKIASAIF